MMGISTEEVKNELTENGGNLYLNMLLILIPLSYQKLMNCLLM